MGQMGANSISGVTQNPFVEESSLMGGGGMSLVAPNFVSDCFFLAHILIQMVNEKKMERHYEQLAKAHNEAIKNKDW